MRVKFTISLSLCLALFIGALHFTAQKPWELPNKS